MTRLKMMFIPFVKDVDVNRANLASDLPHHICKAGVQLEGALYKAVNRYCPNDCYVGRAEVYDESHLNVFVKSSPGVPAIGFIKVRPNVVPIDMATLLQWAEVSGDGNDFDSALGCYMDDVNNRLGADLSVPADLGALRTEFDAKYKQALDIKLREQYRVIRGRNS